MAFVAAAYTAISTFAASGFWAGVAVRVAGAIIFSAASKALRKKPDDSAQLQGRMVTIREPVSPRRIIYGRGRYGGIIAFINESSTNNQRLDIVIILAGHRVKSIGAVYFNGAKVIEAGSYDAMGAYFGQASCDRALGDDNQTAFPVLRQVARALWTADHRLRGCAAIHVTLVANPDLYPTGIPNITVDIEGKDDVLDPRTGLRGYTENAALCVADYMAHPLYGIGAAIGAPDGIHEADLIAAANVCDEVVAKVGGGTETRYSCNGALSTESLPADNIPALLTAMAGSVAYHAGQWSILAGAYRPPTISLTSDDVREGGLTLVTRFSRSENFNAVRGTFISPENDWQQDDFPAYESAVYLTEDNGERVYRDIALPFTISASMAQRLAKIELERQRRQMTVSLRGKLDCWQAGVGDVVMLTYDRWALAAKPFDVAGVRLDLQSGDGAVQILPELTLRETSPLVYDWSASEAKIYAAAPRTNLPSAFNVSPPGTPTATESQYQTADGAGVKVKVTLTWPASTSPFVAVYGVRARLVGTTAWLDQGRTDTTGMEILDWQPGNWEFEVRAISALGVSSTRVSVIKEITGLGADPVALTGVTIQSAGGLAVLKWAQHADLDVRIGGAIVIRHSAAVVPTWANSVSMDRVPGASAIAVVPLKPGAYVLRAEDSSGNLGPAFVISTAGAVALTFTGVGTLTEDTTFTGTKTNCFVVGGTLQMSSSSQIDSWASVDAIADVDAEGGIVPTATYVFATKINAGAVTRMRLRSVIDLSVLSITDQMDTRTGDIDTWLSIDGADGAEIDAFVEISTTQTDPSASPVWSAWGRVDSSEVSAWGVQARLQMLNKDPSFNLAISQLRLIAEKVV